MTTTWAPRAIRNGRAVSYVAPSGAYLFRVGLSWRLTLGARSAEIGYRLDAAAFRRAEDQLRAWGQ